MIDWSKKKIIFGVFLSSVMGTVFAEFYIISLIQMAQELGTTDDMVQYTVAIYLMGGAFSGAFFGPISDRYGRRKPFLLALFLTSLTSCFCANATSIYALILLRFCQGFSTSGCAVLVPTIYRTLLSGKDLKVLYFNLYEN